MSDDALIAALRALTPEREVTTISYVPTGQDAEDLLARISATGSADEAIAVVAAFFESHWGLRTDLPERIKRMNVDLSLLDAARIRDIERELTTRIGLRSAHQAVFDMAGEENER